MSNKNYKLDKKNYSEYVIRNSLYWQSQFCSWHLEETPLEWIVVVEAESPKDYFEFERLLNDYKLREAVMSKTNDIRTSIVDSVLNGIDRGFKDDTAV